MTEMTPVESMNLEILRMVQMDTAAAEKAIVFVNGEQLKYELFKSQYALAQTEQTPLARTEKAVREAKEALTLFSTTA